MAKIAKPDMVPVQDEFHKISAMHLALKRMREKQLANLRIKIGEDQFRQLVKLLAGSSKYIILNDPSKTVNTEQWTVNSKKFVMSALKEQVANKINYLVKANDWVSLGASLVHLDIHITYGSYPWFT